MAKNKSKNNTADMTESVETSEKSKGKENAAGKKSGKSTSPETKTTIIQCTALVLSALIAIFSFSTCLNKISDANKSITDSIGGASSDENAYTQNDMFDDAFSDSEGPSQDQQDEAAPEEISDDSGSSSSDDSAASSSDSGSSASAQKPSQSKKEAAPQKPSSKEEIVAYFNTSINKVKSGAKSITIVSDESYQAGGIDLASLGAFESMIDKLINSFMGPNKEKTGLTLTSAADKQKYFPVENEAWASKLTAADVKEAKCTEKDGVYTIGLKVYDDELYDNPTNGSNHHTRAFSVVKAGDINANAGAAKSLLSGLKTGYKNGTIICKIDSKTGNVISASYDYVWILHVDSFGGVDAPFGGRQSFDIKW